MEPQPSTLPQQSARSTPEAGQTPTNGDVIENATGQEESVKEVQPSNEAFRPGLGPMIKKKAIANKLMKAASTLR